MHWSLKEEQFLIDNYHLMPRHKLQLILKNRTLGSISAKARLLKLTNYENNRRWNSTLKYDKRFFKDINSSSAYWAGFIAADGYISSKENKIRIKLALKDKVQLQQFKKALNFTGNIREYVRDTNVGNNYSTCYLDLCGAKEMIKDLKDNFNLDASPKSLNVKPPLKILTTNHKLAYIKGLIDGDGHIRKDGKTFEVLAGELLSYWMKHVFLDINYTIRIRDKKITKGLKVVYKTDLNLLYLINSSSTFGLERKWVRLPYQVIDIKNQGELTGIS